MITEVTELFEAFGTIDQLTPALPVGTYFTSSMSAMGIAQTELMMREYTLVDNVMDEGHYYRLRFVPDFSAWPETIDLCHLAMGTSVPPLALMYRDEHGDLQQFIRAGRVTPHTDSTSAKFMLSTFREDRSLAAFEPFWMPVFEGSPLALMR